MKFSHGGFKKFRVGTSFSTIGLQRILEVKIDSILLQFYKIRNLTCQENTEIIVESIIHLLVYPHFHVRGVE